MATARYLIKLVRSQSEGCLVERKVSRDGQERAVFYAQNWLVQAQRFEHYFGITYDMYEIYQQDANGDWINIDTGRVQDAETGRAKARAETGKSKTPGMDTKGRTTKGRKRRTTGDDPHSPLFVTDKLVGKAKHWTGRKAVSPLRQRINESLAIARQTLADKKAQGDP